MSTLDGSTATTGTGEARRFAMVVATSIYSDPQLGRLRAPAADATALAAVLADRSIGGFEVTSVVDQTSPVVQLAIDDFLSDRKRDELVVLYLSCHGVKDTRGRLHFAATNTFKSRLASTSVAASWVNERLEECRASSQILILDCCFSGAFARGAKGDNSPGLDRLVSPGRGRVVLTASNSTEYSFESDVSEAPVEGSPVRGSVFTEALLQGLRSGEADVNGDGIVTVDEAYEYAYRLVRASEAAQTPERWVSFGQGSLVLARAPNEAAHSDGLTRSLRTRLEHGRPDVRLSAVEELRRWLDSEDEARVATATRELQAIAINDIPRVAAAANAALTSVEPRAQEPDQRRDGRSSPDSDGEPPGPQHHWMQEVPDPPRTVAARGVGIDLGTTKSLVAVLEDGVPTIVANAEGSLTTPSVVAIALDGQILVGEAAKRQAVTNVERTIRSVKRHMGTGWKVRIDDQEYGPQQISAFVLQKLKRDVEAYLGEQVTNVVITVPAYFSDAEREATKEAGEIAGLIVDRVISEPTAAALAYGLDKAEKEQTILVFDLGGGSFDVSLLEIGDGVFEVKATKGDTRLGGDDWDARIVDWLVKQFKDKNGIDLGWNTSVRARLQEAAEKAKIELSSASETGINLPYITLGEAGPLHLEEKLTRSQFQRLTSDLLNRCRAPINAVLDDARIGVDQIDQVILVGGSTRMPAVVDLVRGLMGGKEPNRGVNREEVVALGASLQSGVLRGEVTDVLLLDVTPLSLGVETKGGVLTKIIERNTTVPTRWSQVFTTADDNQSSVRIRAYRGERDLARDNRFLGELELTGLSPEPRGVPQIEVGFDIDANGVVYFFAKDLASQKVREMVAHSGSTPTEGDHHRHSAAELALRPPAPPADET